MTEVEKAELLAEIRWIYQLTAWSIELWEATRCKQ